MKSLLRILLLTITSFSYATLNYTSKQYIVLIPGAASSGENISIRGLTPIFGPIKQGKYFKHFESVLKNEGFNVLICPKIQDLDKRNLNNRARDCSAFLLSKLIKYPNARFHLVGHSMGGLVARRLLDYRLTSRFIGSVTTISTPHHGAMVANYIIKNQNSSNLVAQFIKLIQFRTQDRSYIEDLKITDNINLYTSKLKNRRKIKVYSISNYRTNWYNGPLILSSKILEREAKYYKNRSKKNDGVIETSSMIFGEHIAEIQADHMESACVLHTSLSRACRETLKVLIKHLNKLTVLP